MLRVGLTGGIACGKSTVAAMLRELSCTVIEADPLAHQLIEPGQPAYEEVRREFGAEVLGRDGRVDRGKLGAIVFRDSAKLQRLNQIVHPRMREELDRRLAELERSGVSIAVVEAALLVEAHYTERLDRLVVAWCRPEQQLERLLERGMSREEAERRIAAQMPIEQKRRLADDEIDCSGSLSRTREQTEALGERLRQMAGRGAKDGA
jgi:dephospho-CoA kinase